MVLLQVAPGKDPPSRVTVTSFPFEIGRAPENHLQLSDPGVWARHLRLELSANPLEIRAVAASEALCLLNGSPFREAALRAGDLLQAGSCRIQFSLAPARQKSLTGYEYFIWGLVMAIAAAQAFLLFWV